MKKYYKIKALKRIEITVADCGKFARAVADKICEIIGVRVPGIAKIPIGYPGFPQPRIAGSQMNRDRGTGLGQAQRMSIVRTILKNSPTLILDEATSSVDSGTGLLIQQALERLTENKTCITIAHRLSTILGADKILLIENGQILEEGNGDYAHFYNLQFEFKSNPLGGRYGLKSNLEQILLINYLRKSFARLEYG